MHHYTVEGMTCQHCVKAVTEAVEQVDSDAAVTVDLAGDAVTVDSSAGGEAIREAIESAGYKAQSRD